MKIKIEALQKFAKQKDWNIPELAKQLGVEYSYLSRVLNNKKNGGTKLFSGIYMLCKNEEIDVEKFIFLPKQLSIDNGNKIKNKKKPA